MRKSTIPEWSADSPSVNQISRREIGQHDLFPFKEIRSGQREFLNDVQRTVEEGKILIAHAPTGIGKTAAALAPTLKYGMEHDKIVLFLTSKQSQHKIAVDTLKLMRRMRDFTVVDVISKQDMCPRRIAKEHPAVFNEICKIEQKTRSCGYFLRHDDDVIDEITKRVLHVEELMDLCKNRGMCPHKTALDVAKYADVMVCDYNYIFSDLSETILQKIGRSLHDIIIIVDEAHNLPERIRNNLNDELSLWTLKEAESEIRHSPSLYHYIKEMDSFFQNFASKMKEEEINVEMESFVDGVNRILRSELNPIEYEDFVKELKEVAVEIEEEGEHVMGIAEFLDGWNSTNECSRIFSNRDRPKLSFKLLDPSILSSDILALAHSTIMMSGTLYPMEMYAALLGVNPERMILRAYDSPFPQENRLIAITKELTTRYVERTESMYMKMANEISEIEKDVNVNGNIAVFFPSYALMESIMSYLPPSRRRIIERREMSKKQKNRLYERLKNDGGMLLGVQAGSLSEGLDYEDNLLSVIIVVGLPLSPPTLEVNNTTDYYIKKFGGNIGRCYGYVYPAVNKALQAAGRGIRNENDICAIILMDYRFQFSPYKDCFPPDYEVRVTNDASELCGSFFDAHKRSLNVERRE
jgi:DNA excision repair protein ERCC-2